MEVKIDVRKYEDLDNDKVVLEIKYNSVANRLFKRYAVVNDGAVDGYIGNTSYQRYKVKNILVNSVRSWESGFFVLFMKELIDNGKVKIQLESMRDYTYFTSCVSGIRELVNQAELLKQNEQVEISIECNTGDQQ